MRASLAIASILVALLAVHATGLRIKHNDSKNNQNNQQFTLYDDEYDINNKNNNNYNLNNNNNCNDRNCNNNNNCNGRNCNLNNNNNGLNNNNNFNNNGLNNNNNNGLNNNNNFNNNGLNNNNNNGLNNNYNNNYNNNCNYNNNNCNNNNGNNDYDNSFEAKDNGNNSGEQYESSNSVTVSPSNSLSNGITKKFAALEKIIANEQQISNNNIGVQDIQNPVNVRQVVVKMSRQSTPQRHFVNFQNGQMTNIDNGHLEYVSINQRNDNVFVQYKFNQLKTVGSYKSDLPEAQNGRFNVQLNNVRTDVSSSFNAGQGIIRPAQFEYADLTINNENGQETQVLNEPVQQKYLNVLEQTISNAVYESTHKGLLAKLKAEIQSPITFNNNGQQGKLYDMAWQENNNNIQMNNIGVQNIQNNHKQIDSMSYTRMDANTYRVRFTTNLNDVQWNGDFSGNLNGNNVQAKSCNFNANNILVQVSVVKSINNQQCQNVRTNVNVDGLRYSCDGQIQQNIDNIMQQDMPRFIKHSLEAYMKKSVGQEICNNKYNQNNQ
ncbi:putative uncharacterized protein DDB_G0286901 isoform X2 [Adelges cooleyi]|uniref:putative uncharacterized protein DDB_G0286901 isoform X2 n=1 Tax=Adelges cooleyi TaxID=133065 RepID=UPI00217F27C4|nr:putative uncharacterized protein DDB_G0286901 isoform X2 [Adelges cooleyi]